MGEITLSLRQALGVVKKNMVESGVDSPDLSAEIILAESLALDRMDMLKELILNPERPLSVAQGETAQAMAARRCSGEPVAYILGRKEFYGRTFRVTPHTLIPRPETELLVEAAIALARNAVAKRKYRFADLGTGSGCIAVSLALALPKAEGVAVDKSPQALDVARENARNLHAANLSFLCADFTHPLLKDASCDLIVSNPPYVSEQEYREISPEVRLFEPKSALVPSLERETRDSSKERADGLEYVAHIVRLAERALHSGGWLLVEIGFAQGDAARALPDSVTWRQVEVRRDLAGLDRLLVAQKG